MAEYYTQEEIKESIDTLMSAFEAFKRIIQSSDKSLYERWKAGGCAVDSGFYSMYPAAEEVAETLANSLKEEEKEWNELAEEEEEEEEDNTEDES